MKCNDPVVWADQSECGDIITTKYNLQHVTQQCGIIPFELHTQNKMAALWIWSSEWLKFSNSRQIKSIYHSNNVNFWTNQLFDEATAGCFSFLGSCSRQWAPHVPGLQKLQPVLFHYVCLQIHDVGGSQEQAGHAANRPALYSNFNHAQAWPISSRPNVNYALHSISHAFFLKYILKLPLLSAYCWLVNV